jgi:TRAP-type C4-dicarboxylate transport system substrate-binding protein
MNVRWVIAHEPIDLFLRAANAFAEKVSAATSGKMQIEVMTITDYSNRYNNGVQVSKYEIADRLQAGEMEMSQLYTPELGDFNKDFHALDMPFLFKDHEHASRVLEGEIGQQLMADVAANSKIRGLAFTYSGGFRMVPASKAIQSIEDFAGVKVRVSERTPVAMDTFLAIGADPVQMAIEEVGPKVGTGEIGAGESTYPRYYSMGQAETCDFINDTKHSLFLTTIVINEDFWNSLDAETQAIVSDAAFMSARLERAESLVDADETIAKAQAEGKQVVAFSEEETAKFKKATEGLYEKYKDYFTPGLISAIQAA